MAGVAPLLPKALSPLVAEVAVEVAQTLLAVRVEEAEEAEEEVAEAPLLRAGSFLANLRIGRERGARSEER